MTSGTITNISFYNHDSCIADSCIACTKSKFQE